jgi:hypothetical protein
MSKWYTCPTYCGLSLNSPWWLRFMPKASSLSHVCSSPLHRPSRSFLFVSLLPYYVAFFLALIFLYFQLHYSSMIHYNLYGAHCNMLPSFVIVFMVFIVINNQCFNVSITVLCCSLWILYVFVTFSFYSFISLTFILLKFLVFLVFLTFIVFIN